MGTCARIDQQPEFAHFQGLRALACYLTSSSAHSDTPGPACFCCWRAAAKGACLGAALSVGNGKDTVTAAFAHPSYAPPQVCTATRQALTAWAAGALQQKGPVWVPPLVLGMGRTLSQLHSPTLPTHTLPAGLPSSLPPYVHTACRPILPPPLCTHACRPLPACVLLLLRCRAAAGRADLPPIQPPLQRPCAGAASMHCLTSTRYNPAQQQRQPARHARAPAGSNCAAQQQQCPGSPVCGVAGGGQTR